MMIATEFDLRRLRNNDQRLTALFLNFTEKPHPGGHQSAGADHQHLTDLQSALKQNTSLTSIMITADDSFAASHSTTVVAERHDGILKDVGRLPKLKRLQLSSLPKGTGVLPVQALTLMLKETNQLECLLINDLTLTGSQTEFDQLSHQVQSLWFLRRFSIDGCQVRILSEQNEDGHSSASSSFKTTTSSSSSAASLDSLLLSLSMLPSLQVLSLSSASKTTTRTNVGDNKIPFSSSAFSALFLSSSLQSLQLRGWNWTEDYLISMAQLLQTNGTLQALTVGPLPGAMTTQVAKSLSAMLQSNKTLLHLELGLSDNMISDEIATILAQALRNSSSLHSFHLSSSGRQPRRMGRVMSKKCKMAFLEAIQDNFSLQYVILFHKKLLQKDIAFYTRLNAMGRKTMLRLADSNGSSATNDPIRATPEEAWVEALAHPILNNDLSSIFYFLSNNPSLCTSGANKKRAATAATQPNVVVSGKNKRRKLS